ncbi:hypothetical protein RsTz2092_06010 [Deferribacterales bacterium RsTz2092]|nr:hypothetical protein AGMMS49941_03600 [Deferribacterales bacterium]
MKVYFILEDTLYYIPQMLDTVLADKHYDYVEVACVSELKKAGKIGWNSYLKRHILDIGIISCVKLVLIGLKGLIAGKTVHSIAKKHDVPVIDVKNVNDKSFIQHIKDLDIDVVVSSNPQIFKKELLNAPNIACINRHSALLPANGGLLPVFYAIVSGEAYTGATIHKMDVTIDTGQIICQRAIEIPARPVLSDLYEKCYALSAELILQALEILEKNLPEQPLKEPTRQASYHSLPTADDWRKFKNRGAKFA